MSLDWKAALGLGALVVVGAVGIAAAATPEQPTNSPDGSTPSVSPSVINETAEKRPVRKPYPGEPSEPGGPCDPAGSEMTHTDDRVYVCKNNFWQLKR